MREKNIAVIGAFGYGRLVIDEVLKNGKDHNSRLVAVADTSPAIREESPRFVSRGVKTYQSIDEMYAKDAIDLTVVASPIQYHSLHACTAMENGSHVLLEKPIAGCMEDAREIAYLSKVTGKKALVGFQLIYDETIRKVKEIILSGRMGGLCDMKCIVLWPRSKNYFARNGWAGKISDNSGRLVRDSVANNATAHHFMTLLYFAGSDMQSAGETEVMDAALYRVNDIETFDTCALKAELKGGIGMLAIASHATQYELSPKYMLWFERGYIECEGDAWKMYADGKEETIGTSDHTSLKKVWDMAKYIDDENYPVKCTLECAMAHTKMIEQISDIPITELKDDIRESEGRLYAEGLEEKLKWAYDNYSLPEI